jgi:CRISPR/Cas system-associated protein Cas10 (large subunit of type III CRISPR-Cas system)
MNYLYGASVQGIQEFIFTTNKLKEIVGASEIVKSISQEIETYQPDTLIVNAAGNIKAVFNDEEKIKKVVLEFPKLIIQKAYGITISQAVITFDSEYPQPDDFNKLEAKLKTQRNLQSPPLDLSLNITKLAPTTAKPIVEEVKIQKNLTPIDKATHQKRKANNKDELYNDISELSNGRNKIAIIHADGNGLGKLVPTLGKKLKEFSENLDIATNKAFDLAQNEDMKIRKVILGGDDMTIICDADSALEFTKNYLIHFEEQSEKITGHKLTACAGITYCNKKYPFHYAVTLAEELCSASKDASNRESSCLLFHNIQSSNVESYEKFIEDELTIGDLSLNYGPYYTDAAKGTSLIHFQNLVNALALKNSPISSLRQWIGELSFNKEYAQNMIERIDEMADLKKDYKKKSLNNAFKELDENLSLRNPIVNNKTPIYDVLQILSVTKGSK